MDFLHSIYASDWSRGSNKISKPIIGPIEETNAFKHCLNFELTYYYFACDNEVLSWLFPRSHIMHLLLVQFSHAESHLGPREGSPLPRAGVRQPMWRTGGRLEESSCRWFGWSWFIFMDIKKVLWNEPMKITSLIYLFTAFAYSFISPDNHPFIHISIFFIFHSFINSLINLFIHNSFQTCIHLSFDNFFHSFIYLFIHSCIQSSNHLSRHWSLLKPIRFSQSHYRF